MTAADFCFVCSVLRMLVVFCSDSAAALEDAFFDMEIEMENNMCRDLVCLKPEAERRM